MVFNGRRIVCCINSAGVSKILLQATSKGCFLRFIHQSDRMEWLDWSISSFLRSSEQVEACHKAQAFDIHRHMDNAWLTLFGPLPYRFHPDLLVWLCFFVL